jgi:glucoamylase
MSEVNRSAPGGPGISARWTSSAKTGVGTALSDKSHVWFTLSHGILNEIYYPRIDQACIRDMGLIVTDGADFFSEEKRDADSEVQWLADGVPAFQLVNTSRDGRYRIEKQIITDPHRDAVLQKVHFAALKGSLSSYQLYVLLAPHLENRGGGNTAWVDEFDPYYASSVGGKRDRLQEGCSRPEGSPRRSQLDPFEAQFPRMSRHADHGPLG